MSKESAEVTLTEDDLSKFSLRERILRVMNEIRVIKNGRNTFSNYEYFKPEEINQRVNPLLLKYKVFPLFYTYYDEYDKKIIETLGETTQTVTEKEYREIAELRFEDVYGKETPVIYQMPIERADIKGANEMQKIGGTRTYAKRYLYMEALNISDNKLDLDTGTFNKTTGKAAQQNAKLDETITKISQKVDELRNNKVSNTEIANAIKSVYTDGGKPSANYKTCKDVNIASAILAKLMTLKGGV